MHELNICEFLYACERLILPRRTAIAVHITIAVECRIYVTFDENAQNQDDLCRHAGDSDSQRAGGVIIHIHVATNVARLSTHSETGVDGIHRKARGSLYAQHAGRVPAEKTFYTHYTQCTLYRQCDPYAVFITQQ